MNGTDPRRPASEGAGGGAHAGALSAGVESPSWALAQPLRLGGVELPNRVALAPMAGVTTSAYRLHLKRRGAGLVCTEMVSAYGLLYHNRRTEDYLEFREEERPLAVQLFGDEPEALGRATAMVLQRERRPDVIDINMGCPVRKVVKTGAGAALLAEPARAAAVAAAVVRAAADYGVPVTVKLRTGLEPGHEVAVEVARRLEHVGVTGLCLHPRAASQFYQGRADHEVTARVVAAVGLPVFASGDITSLSAAAAVLAQSGAAGVMVARGVLGDPWLAERLVRGEEMPPPGADEVIQDLRILLAAAAADMGPQRAARWIRKHLGWYLRPLRIPGSTVAELHHLPDADALDEALAALASSSGQGPRH